MTFFVFVTLQHPDRGPGEEQEEVPVQDPEAGTAAGPNESSAVRQKVQHLLSTFSTDLKHGLIQVINPRPRCRQQQQQQQIPVNRILHKTVFVLALWNLCGPAKRDNKASHSDKCSVTCQSCLLCFTRTTGPLNYFYGFFLRLLPVEDHHS